MQLIRKYIAEVKGSVMMESIVMLPVMLIALMAAVQFAHIFFARHLTEYAAYCAARSGRYGADDEVAAENALKAAKQVCSLLSLTAPAGAGGVLYALPWLGEVEGTQALDSKLSVNCPYGPVPSGAFGARVTMNFPLVVPVVNQFFSGLFKFRQEVVSSDPRLQEGTLKSYAVTYTDDIFPHVTITRSAFVPANPVLAD